MAKIDDVSIVTEEDIALAETSNTILLYNMATKTPNSADDYGTGASIIEIAHPNNYGNVIATANYHIKKGLVSIPKRGRMIGLILQEYGDGSKRVAIYSQNPFSIFNNSKGMTIEHTIRRQIQYANVVFSPDSEGGISGTYVASNPPIDYTYSIFS